MPLTIIPRVIELRITCEACPWQAEGKFADGQVFYMRHRFCSAQLGIGATIDEAVKDSFTHWIEYHEDNGDCGKPAGEGYCSGLEGEEIAYVFQRLWQERTCP